MTRCELCRFWEKVDWLPDAGYCRRRSPEARQVLKEELTEGTFNTPVWPLTQRHDWCGEFEPF